MNPLAAVRRASRWVLAAGMAFASLGAPPASSQTPALERADAEPLMRLERDDPPRGRVEPFFQKVGKQRSCEIVRYRLRFGAQGDPEKLANPSFVEELKTLRMDFRDQLPAGLSVVDVQVSGDITDAAGGPAPTHQVSTTASPNDTVEISDFRLSGDDLDGDGTPDKRFFDVMITAKIDPAAFPAPATVPNQGFVRITRQNGMVVEVPSHDPLLPDDGVFQTGAPTMVRIDLTGCDRPPPPPPPGDEACFKVEFGEVDCVPGGAAFIYEMPVGPEMAGRLVQLKTTTPGVTIDPPGQIVPAGGGVLSWEISGAAPGDVVVLIVTGVELYEGPAEGVGLCCSQVVEIVIPQDLDCPDKEREPDIRVQKKADVERCTPEGGCDFTIRVSNVGDGPYTGKIVLEEVTLAPGATVTSGPNAPWSCVPGVTPMMCEHPETTLDPGAFVDLKLGFKPGPGDVQGIRNCAEYDYDASGKPLFGSQANDRACASIPLCVKGDPRCDPGVEKRADIGITKRARTLECSADGVCTFIVDIVNTGTETIDGPLTVIDEYPLGAPVSSEFGPMPPWVCGPEGPGTFRCDHPGIVLPPAATTSIGVKAIVGPDYPGGDIIENCATVQPVPGESDLSNNRACATMRIPGREPKRPNITVEKTGDAVCRPGEPCTFEITFANAGPGDFSGTMNIGDAIQIEGMGGLTVPINEVVPPFGCTPEPTELPFMCEANMTLGAGESRVHQVTVTLPADGELGKELGPNGVRGRNCVGVVPPGVVVMRGGELQEGRPLAGAPDGSREGEFACHEFQVLGQEVPQCSPGFVMNADGRCVCPEGTRFRNGQCVDGGATVVPIPPVKPVPPIAECRLLPGMIRTQDGRCVCPRGTTLRGGRCVERPPVVEQCRLLPGMIRTQDGRCVCPRGTTLRGGRCVERPVVEQCRLLPGMIRTNDGKCVCPRGTRLRGGRCVDVTPPRVECKRGEVLRNGKCVPVQIRRCPQGTVGTPPNCRKVETTPRRCPQGTVGTPPNCRPAIRINPNQLRQLLPQQRERPQRQIQ